LRRALAGRSPPLELRDPLAFLWPC
jgi:hypothetical protein